MGRARFIIVGAERCGTTSLYHNICKHSQINAAYKKEIEYFDKHYDKGIDWYEMNLGEGITGEATPTYFWNPVAAKRIYEYNPSIKIIITLRDKEQAIRSKYNQQVAKGVETLSYEDALKYEDIRVKGSIERALYLPYNHYPRLYSEYAYRDRYDYDKHLKNWEPFKNKLIINDYFTNTEKRMDEVFRFIGVYPEAHEWEILNKGI